MIEVLLVCIGVYFGGWITMAWNASANVEPMAEVGITIYDIAWTIAFWPYYIVKDFFSKQIVYVHELPEGVEVVEIVEEKAEE